jgi:hypothetical protein
MPFWTSTHGITISQCRPSRELSLHVQITGKVRPIAKLAAK